MGTTFFVEGAHLLREPGEVLTVDARDSSAAPESVTRPTTATERILADPLGELTGQDRVTMATRFSADLGAGSLVRAAPRWVSSFLNMPLSLAAGSYRSLSSVGLELNGIVIRAFTVVPFTPAGHARWSVHPVRPLPRATSEAPRWRWERHPTLPSWASRRTFHGAPFNPLWWQLLSIPKGLRPPGESSRVARPSPDSCYLPAKVLACSIPCSIWGTKFSVIHRLTVRSRPTTR